jgi:hypothetical protein
MLLPVARQPVPLHSCCWSSADWNDSGQLPQETTAAVTAHLFVEVCAQGLTQSDCCGALALTQGCGGDAANHHCRPQTRMHSFLVD